MPDLRRFLHETFEKAGGAVPFDQFMAMALYDPNFGYYAAGIEDVGGMRGDFATSATLTKGLGRAIAKWIQEERDHHDWEAPVSVIEVGAGNGALALEVLRSFGWWKRRQIRYHIVDVSAPLREKQQAALKSFPVDWHANVSEALEATGGKALIFSNELVDAFPAKWLRWLEIEACWLEVLVKFDRDAGLSEVLQPLPKGFPDYDYSALSLKNPACGQRVEIQPLFQRWLANLSEHLREGSILTIDYGGKPEDIYHRRPGGSLRGYYKQERIEGGCVYQRFGKQDLTVDVNFTDLISWGEDFGLETVREESQADFLQRFGEGADAMGSEGVGEAFRVLVQRC
ncbi:MAG: SAM-dependent methyltransferase [Verrucomicrobiales bacterium]|jgi:SAM-dependent MidA family methyltransferase|nr:SAM-dependent methyltransferase [Verrucomicrobiales bacterium]